MTTITSWIKKHSLLTFFILAYALSWIVECGGLIKLDTKWALLRGMSSPISETAKQSQTRLVSDIPTMNGCVSYCTHPR
jgi:hypothetical protein